MPNRDLHTVGAFTRGSDSTDVFTTDQHKRLNEIASNARRQVSDFIKFGTKDDLFTNNIAAVHGQLPFIFPSDESIRKYYFSDKPEAQESQNYINYYFDVACDSAIEKDDFCEARIFDPEKSLYVKG